MASDPTPPGNHQNRPFVMACQAGKYAWCRCDRSDAYPMCDGTHRGSDSTPLKVVFDEPRQVAWCACGQSKGAPFCDGTHAQLS